jgi:hypothetical protein
VFIKYDIHTLANIVIANPMQMDLFPWSCVTQGFATSNANQAKENSYCNQHPINQLFPLTIKVFGCLHKHANVFLHDCVNAICSLKGTKSFHLSTLVIFLRQKISITLQKMQTSSILSQAIAIGFIISQLPTLQDTPPITTTDLLQAVNFWHVTMADLPQAINYGRT